MGSKCLKLDVSRIRENTRTKSTFQFFSECYEDVHKRPCGSNTVELDAKRYERATRMGIGPIVPNYVSQHFEKQEDRNFLVNHAFGVACSAGAGRAS